MAFQISPGVAVVEKDLTTIVPAVSTTAGGFVGIFEWGPVDQRVIVDGVNNLRSLYGDPNDDNAQYWWTAANFLQYGRNLQVVRVVDSASCRNAVTIGNSTTLVKNQEHYTELTPSVKGWIAKYPGIKGASIKTSLCDDADFFNGDKVLSGEQWITKDTNILYGGVFSTEVISGYQGQAVSDMNTDLSDDHTGGNQSAMHTDGKKEDGGTDEDTDIGTDTVVQEADFENELNVGDIIVFTNGQELAVTEIVTEDRDPNNAYVKLKSNFTGTTIAEGTGFHARVKWQYASKFDDAPGTSDFASKRSGSSDEMHVIVVDFDGLWTGVAGEILESFSFVSKAKDATFPSGATAYYKEVINLTSKYIWWGGAHMDDYGFSNTTPTGSDWGVNASGITYKKVGRFPYYGDVNESSLGALDTDYQDRLKYTNADTDGEPGTNSRSTNLEFGLGKAGQSSIHAGRGNQGQLVAHDEHEASYTTKVSNGDRTGGYDLFEDAETVDVSLLLVGPSDSGAVVPGHVIDLCDARKDCVAFVSPYSATPSTLTASDIKTFRNTTLNKSSSYAVMDTGYKYQYDRFRDVFRYVPLNADIAGLCVRTDQVTDPWFSPAGFNRGRIRSLTRLGYNPKKTDRDTLYGLGVNPVVTFPGQGTILFGDKTLQSKPSAFDRINVRRLFIVLEKAIAIAAKYQLFELNDSFTRAQFKQMIEPFLRDVQSRRGMYDFRVVCDESNNTGEVIDNNKFVADIFVKPTRSINFIQLNFVATRTGVSFEEVGG